MFKISFVLSTHRLNLTGTPLPGSWIELDLGKLQWCGGIATQQAGTAGERVTRYSLSYSESADPEAELTAYHVVGQRNSTDTAVEGSSGEGGEGDEARHSPPSIPTPAFLVVSSHECSALRRKL